MDSRRLFERRDELKHVMKELRNELKDIEDKLSDEFFTSSARCLELKR